MFAVGWRRPSDAALFIVGRRADWRGAIRVSGQPRMMWPGTVIRVMESVVADDGDHASDVVGSRELARARRTSRRAPFGRLSCVGQTPGGQPR